MTLPIRNFMLHKVSIVTGAGGFIGGNLVRHLHRIRRKDHKAETIIPLDKAFSPALVDEFGTFGIGHRCVELDFTKHDMPPWQWSFANYKNADITIYHVGARARIKPSFNEPSDYVRNNVLGTSQVLEQAELLAKQNRVHVVFAGSSTCDSDPFLNFYAMSKQMGEGLCKMYVRHTTNDLKVSIARFYNVYGPGQCESGDNATLIGIYEKALREDKKFMVTGDGFQTRDFTHIDDVVRRISWVGELKDKWRTSWTGELKDKYHHAISSVPIYSLGDGKNYPINIISHWFADGDKHKIIYEDARKGEAKDTRSEPFTQVLPIRDIETYIKELVARKKNDASEISA